MEPREPAEAERAEEFVRLYAENERRLYAYVSTLVPHLSDAEDVLQETYRVLWQKLDDYRRDQPFLTWAFGVAYREVLNHRQKQRTRRRYFRDGVIEHIAAEAGAPDDSRRAYVAALEVCLEALPKDERAIIDQRYGAEGTLQELASRLGRTANSLYKTLQRARQKLLRCIEWRTEHARG